MINRDDWIEMSKRSMGTRGDRPKWGFSELLLWLAFPIALFHPAPKEPPHDD